MMLQTSPHILVLYGSTASGKSAFAMDVADQLAAVIINADAMQCYAPLRLITARPSLADEARHPHALYGIWQAHQHGDVAMWLSAVSEAIETAWSQGRLPILVGGTGMYVKALMQGLNAIPKIPKTISDAVMVMSPEMRYQALMHEDAVMANKLNSGDTQRIARALEVVRATGKSLADWQATPTQSPLQKACFHPYHIQLPREILYARINARFDAMLDAGILDEVQAFLQTNPDSRAPIGKAHGVPEMKAYFAGDMALDEAILKAKQHTRNYAKRQQTWARGQFSQATNIAPDQAGDCIDQMKKLLQI
jgi:tRNA dimethylallyltransferase